MKKIRVTCIAALTLPGCIDQTAPEPEFPVDGKWCERVGTFPHASGRTITYENITWFREEIMEGSPWIVEVRGCKVTINPPQT